MERTNEELSEAIANGVDNIVGELGKLNDLLERLVVGLENGAFLPRKD